MWAEEGLNDYFGVRVAHKSGNWTEAEANSEFLNMFVDYTNRVLGTEYDVPITEADKIATGPNSPGYVVWYKKGALVNHLLDYQVSRFTEGKKSIEDVPRIMNEFVLNTESKRIELEDFISACNFVTRHDFSNFFAAYVTGISPLPFVIFDGSLQVNDALLPDASPLPSRFADVSSGHWSHDSVEKIYLAGLTDGCGFAKFCPEEVVTRAQMAVFLERGIQRGGFAPTTAVGVFSDVPIDYWAADWIEQLYQDGVTKGCKEDPLMYCPDQSITRAEMAIFLLRAKYGRSYSPPAATGIFTDVSTGYWAADWVEQLYSENITTGCGDDPLRFCPDDSVTRDQMAAFLVRTFGL